MDYKKLIEKLVDVSQVPFAAAYLNNDGDICEYGPYQINFAHEVPHIPLFTKEQLDRFAELAVAAEREACAKLCEEQMGNTMLLTSYPPKSAAAFQILQLIKARGDKHD